MDRPAPLFTNGAIWFKMGTRVSVGPFFFRTDEMDMKRTTLSHMEISAICRELALLLHAGVGIGSGLALLAEEETGTSLKALLADLSKRVDEGEPLSSALRASGRFPAYVTGLTEVGERSGRMEEALQSLSRYYDDREQMDRRIRGALLYPSVLLVLMLVVIVVLLSQVLPVFDEVYASLGGQLTGVAGGLLALGRVLDTAMPVLCALLLVVVVFLGAFSVSAAFREGVFARWRRWRGDRGISRKTNDARFAQALAMGLGSGLPLEESMDLAAQLLEEVPGAAARCRDCRARLEQGGALAETMRQTGVLPAAACRLLALGVQSGSADTVMEEIAARLSREAGQAIEDRASQVEPALVLVCSILVGAILLSVMLPLMDIMTAIG